MWLIVGLGNPGAKYSMTRHNVGFMAIDAYISSTGGPRYREEHQAQTLKAKIEDIDVLFAKPIQYMNKSGHSVQALMSFYKIPKERLIVLHDDIDQGFGAIKIHKDRGPGGHNGLKSINECLGHQDYVRIKLGVGRPTHPGMDIADYVLQNFSKDEMTHVGELLELAGDAVEALIFKGYDAAATSCTRGPVEPKLE
jgi:peptidyl-tRNA hydrolase, PTH1 family